MTESPCSIELERNKEGVRAVALSVFGVTAHPKISMPLSEKLRCRYELEYLPEAVQKLQTIDNEGYDSLDFDSRMASGGDQVYGIEWTRNKRRKSLAECLEALKTCPDPKNIMGKELAKHCQHEREMLKKFEARRDDLETNGDAAISEHDKRYGYDLEFNKQLNANHLSYTRNQLDRCPPVLIEMTAVEQVPLVTPVEPVSTETRSTEPQTVFKQATFFSEIASDS